MKDIQGRGERSPGAVQAAEVGGRGSTKERDEPLCPFPSPQGNPKQSWAQRGCPEEVPAAAAEQRGAGMADHPIGSEVCTVTGPWLHMERTEFWGESRLGLRLLYSLLKFLK